MSRGLGHLERRILGALQATPRLYVALWELIAFVDGRMTSLDQDARHWRVPICQPHPKLWHSITGLGSWVVDHLRDCYAPEPAKRVQEAVARAVRSLARKGLVEHTFEGSQPKCLIVYLLGTKLRP
jgi:hypothetical protein